MIQKVKHQFGKALMALGKQVHPTAPDLLVREADGGLKWAREEPDGYQVLHDADLTAAEIYAMQYKAGQIGEAELEERLERALEKKMRDDDW